MNEARSNAGWTGGQYSALRFILGGYLASHFAMLLPYGAELFSKQGVLPDGAVSPLFGLLPSLLWISDDPTTIGALIVVAILASLALALGARDRIAALLLWWIWASLHARNPLISTPSLPYVGLLLMLHALLPSAPFGSWQARGRSDPNGGWHYPPSIALVAWWSLMIGYSYSGYTKLVSPSWLSGEALAVMLQNPLARDTPLRTLLLALPAGLLQLMTWSALALELVAAPLAAITRLRPWLWLTLLGMHLGLLALFDFADLSAGMLLMHAFTFNPSWLTPRQTATSHWVFYDGNCGLCHGAVRSLLAEDTTAAFRFAPLGGETFAAKLPNQDTSGPFDTIVLLSSKDQILLRSRAVRQALDDLGGIWRLVSWGMRLFPLPLLDWGYDRIAAIRHRLFKKPDDVCPVVPTPLRTRFSS